MEVTITNTTKIRITHLSAKVYIYISDIPIPYYYSHSITRNIKHNITPYIRKYEGHKDKATLNNKIGGNTDSLKPHKN